MLKTGDIYTFKTKFQGADDTEREREPGNFAPSACFTNAASQMDTLLKFVWALY